MIQVDSTDKIAKLTELLAAHGVYALTIIFIFYLLARASRNLRTASTEDHAYFRKIYTSVVTATYALTIVSTSVWIYATFVYSPKHYIRGSISGLKEQTTHPKKLGDTPRVIEKIIAESEKIEIYHDKKNDPLNEGKFSLSWVAVPQDRDKPKTLDFVLQHQYERINPTRADLQPGTSGGSLETKTVEKRFTLDLQRIKYSPDSFIELKYEPAEDNTKIGKISLKEPDSDRYVELRWDDAASEQKTAENRPAESSWFSQIVAYASSKKTIFKDNGDYDPKLGRVLRERLGSPELKTQLAAREALVDGGSRSFKFIRDTLNTIVGGDSDNRGLLVANLALAVKRIESAGDAVPGDIDLMLAKQFFELQDDESSASFFTKAGNEPIVEKEMYFNRGLVYYSTEKYDQARDSFAEYLKQDQRPYSQAVTHTMLGDSYHKLGQHQQAVEHYKKAMHVYPSLSSPYNSLASLYAERGEKLNEALSLANRSLSLAKTDTAATIATIKGTKGWILYKIKRCDEALKLLREAADQNPDLKIRQHLEEVQRASCVKVNH